MRKHVSIKCLNIGNTGCSVMCLCAMFSPILQTGLICHTHVVWHGMVPPHHTKNPNPTATVSQPHASNNVPPLEEGHRLKSWHRWWWSATTTNQLRLPPLVSVVVVSVFSTPSVNLTFQISKQLRARTNSQRRFWGWPLWCHTWAHMFSFCIFWSTNGDHGERFFLTNRSICLM